MRKTITFINIYIEPIALIFKVSLCYVIKNKDSSGWHKYENQYCICVPMRTRIGGRLTDKNWECYTKIHRIAF